jgi:hypothetical protein
MQRIKGFFVGLIKIKTVNFVSQMAKLNRISSGDLTFLLPQIIKLT